MTRMEFKRKCYGIGLYCWARGKVEREGEHFRVTLKQSASKEWERIETSKVSAWARRVGWRVCIANGATLRRSARVDGGKAKQKQVSNWKGKGSVPSGLQQLHKEHTGSRGNIGAKGNGSNNDGRRTVDKRKAVNGSERKFENRIVERVWIRHRRAPKTRDSRKSKKTRPRYSRNPRVMGKR